MASEFIESKQHMETMIEDYATLVQEFHRLYEEVSFLQARTTTLERENATLKSEVTGFAEELTATKIEDKLLAERLESAKNNASLIRRIAQLEQSLRESKEETTNARSQFGRREEELKLECARAQKEIEFLKVVTKDSSNNLQLTTTAQSTIERNNNEVISMLEENYQQQLEMQRMALVEKQEALLNAKKENAGLRQTYDLKIHELRMKHEEQLLKVAQESKGSQQVEHLRNKLAAQKKDSDAEIAKLKAMITKCI